MLCINKGAVGELGATARTTIHDAQGTGLRVSALFFIFASGAIQVSQEALGGLCLTPPVPIFTQIIEGPDKEMTSTGVLQLHCPEERQRQRQVQVLRHHSTLEIYNTLPESLLMSGVFIF